MVISYLQTNSSAPVTNQFNEGVGYISFVPPSPALKRIMRMDLFPEIAGCRNKMIAQKLTI